MKDRMNERLILLATAQKCMKDITDILQNLDSAHQATEKSTYDLMNASDHILNLSKEGNRLIEILQECCKEVSTSTTADKYLKMSTVLEETRNLLISISETSAYLNDKSHSLEGEIASEKELEDGIRSHLNHAGESLDFMEAYAEMHAAEFNI